MTMPHVQAFLRSHVGDALVAAFVYGSAATGRAGPTSDIDCFILVHGFSTELRERIAAPFAALQRSLGYTPDPEHPVEVFTVHQCRAALTGNLLRPLLAVAATTGQLAPAVAECDEVEILRALLDRRVVLQPATELDALTALAHDVAAAHGGWDYSVLRALRLRRHAPDCPTRATRAPRPQPVSTERPAAPFVVCCPGTAAQPDATTTITPGGTQP
jgi:hypothetical protein